MMDRYDDMFIEPCRHCGQDLLWWDHHWEHRFVDEGCTCDRPSPVTLILRIPVGIVHLGVTVFLLAFWITVIMLIVHFA